ncbi:MAG: SMC family ATPase, partial [Lachnospiraceae bacterium]|nr:SMC family ATPase [Lachnospiraceae bacterium]
MKPIKLIISAFGPYPNKMPEINFEKFEENGLFLISGDTGAGKTTIFDAICYALYGETSGKYKDVKYLRSEYAKADVKTYVDFYFSHQGSNYNVRRELQYEQKNEGGDGITKNEGGAELYKEGVSIKKGIIKVRDELFDILRVNSKQFKQLAMIAQGEFWSLLNAKTSDRTVILRNIFMTESYDTMSKRLKERTKKWESEVTRIENSMIQYFNDVKVDEEDELYNTIQDMQKNATESKHIVNLDDVVSNLENIIASSEERQEKIKDDLDTANNKLKEYNKSMAVAETNNGFITRLEELKEEQAQLGDKKNKIENMKKILDRQKESTHEIDPIYR